MRCMGFVGREEEEDGAEAALESFNELVRERIPHALSLSLGRLGLGYRTVSAMSCATLMRAFDTLSGWLRGDQDWRRLVAGLIESFVVGLATNPLCVAGVLYIASDRPTRRLGCNAFTAILLLKVTLLTALAFGSWFALGKAIDLAESDAFLWEPCAGIAALAAVTVYVYPPTSAKLSSRLSRAGLWLPGKRAAAASIVVGGARR